MQKNHESVVNFPLDLEAALGSAWAECVLDRGGLTVPGWRKPFPPGELRAMFWRCQQVAALERQVALLERDLEHAEARLWAAEKKAAYYRRLVVAESRLGLALLGIVA